MIQKLSWDSITVLLGHRRITWLKIKPSSTQLYVSQMNWLSEMSFLMISSDLRVLVLQILQTRDVLLCESSLKYLSLVCDTFFFTAQPL